MKIAIMQPYFIPYIGYFQMVNAVDTFIFYDNVTYIKNGWINRNRIKGGGILTIPIKNQSSNVLIQNTEISWNPHHVKKLFKTLQQTYSKSPYFNEVFNIIENLINTQPNTISELAINSVTQFSRYMGINTKFKIASQENYKKSNDKVDNLLNICVQEKTNNYINPIGGQSLYNKEDFLSYGINLNFIQTQPSLSILDECMNNSKFDLQKKLNNYKLI
jgi:hypothetical protein